ncbi:MAG: ArnT family glycosyltransferase, partial [Shewanella sp.]
ALLKALADYTDDLTGIGYLLITLGVLWCGLLWWTRQQFALVKMGLVSALGWLIVSTWGYTLLDDVRTPKKLMAQTAAVIGKDAELGLIDFKEQFILFSPMSVTHFSYLAPLAEQERNAWQWMQEKQPRYLLVPSNIKLDCFNIQGGKTMGVAHRNEWVLLATSELTPQCEPPKRQYRYVTDHPGRWLTE